MGYNQSFKQKQHLIRRYGCLLLVFIFGLSVIGCRIDPDSNLKSTAEPVKQLLLKTLPPVENEFTTAKVVSSTLLQKEVLVTVFTSRRNYQFKNYNYSINLPAGMSLADYKFYFFTDGKDTSGKYNSIASVLDILGEAGIGYTGNDIKSAKLLEDCRLVEPGLECGYEYERNVYIYDTTTWDHPKNVCILSEKSSSAKDIFVRDSDAGGYSWSNLSDPKVAFDPIPEAIAKYDSFSVDYIREHYKDAAVDKDVDAKVAELLPEYGIGESNLKSTAEPVKQWLQTFLPPVENEFTTAQLVYSSLQQKEVLVTIFTSRRNYKFNNYYFSKKIVAGSSLADYNYYFLADGKDASGKPKSIASVLDILNEAGISYAGEDIESAKLLEDCRLVDNMDCSYEYERNVYIYDTTTWDRPTNVCVLSEKSSSARLGFMKVSNTGGFRWLKLSDPIVALDPIPDAVAQYDSFFADYIRENYKSAAFNDDIDAKVAERLPEYGLSEESIK